MKKITFFLALAVMALLASSCNDDETYADQLNREKDAIQKYIDDNKVKVISEAQFFAQDTTTDVSQNEYVLMASSGVYMQIVSKGSGKLAHSLESGKSETVLCRFSEYNLLTDSLTLSNNNLYYQAICDKMNVTNTQGTYTASFDTSSSLMYSAYGSSYSSTSVPGGWLVPLPYIKLARYDSPEAEIAKVRIIVPSAEGHAYASANVTPYMYELTYESERKDTLEIK